MNIELRSIENAGDLSRERVVLKVVADDDIGSYALFRCSAADDKSAESGNVLRAYWFSDKEIKKDDFVVLYSKAGVRSEKKSKNGSTSHFFYWRSSSPLWTSEVVPVLVNTFDWQTGAPVTGVPPAD